MRYGHKEAQRLFDELGNGLGYETRRSFSRAYPTDGVWLVRTGRPYGELPFVALEVVVSEGAKSTRGSISTLELVSPALGVILIQEEEIRRGLIARGADSETVERKLAQQSERVHELAARSRQRLQIWNMEQLRRQHRLRTLAVF
jgi:hypothetical protein